MLIKLIEKLITEHGSATILKDRLELVKDQAKILEDENAGLRQEVAELRAEVSMLESKLAAAEKEDEFVEHRGALFKKKPGGGYHQAAYCPTCKTPMGGRPSSPLPMLCGKCQSVTPFRARELNRILAQLPS